MSNDQNHMRLDGSGLWGMSVAELMPFSAPRKLDPQTEGFNAARRIMDEIAADRKTSRSATRKRKVVS